jgi:cysteine desulfuration protein SufE
MSLREKNKKMNADLKNKINELKKFFHNSATSESRYLMIIELGKKLPALPDELKQPKFKIDGCQSTTYVYSSLKDGKVHFKAESDALISAGLAALLIFVYDSQPPSVIIDNPPLFLNELGIHSSLSPSRSNGLAQMYLRMKQDAIGFLEPPN